jgi:Tfp pilus assembly protein PilE
MIIKKAAMFGLDARIALAIFGALSVISGAALYSAIQQAKVTAYNTDLVEMIKAFEAYYLDVGQTLTLTDSTNFESDELVSSSKAGWNGPYLSYPIDSRPTDARYLNQFLRYSKIGDTTVYFSHLKAAAFPNTTGTGNSCPSDSDCSIYLTHSLSNGESRMSEFKEYRAKIDELVDGGDGLAAGNIRGADVASGDAYFYYRIMDKRNYK